MPVKSLRVGVLVLGVILFPWFTTSAQDVVDISLYRSAYYQQLSDAEPEPMPSTDGNDPFTALSVMEMSDAFLSDPENLDFVRAVTLQRPTGPLVEMAFLEEFFGFVAFDTYTSGAALESAYRAGNYRFTFGSFLTGDEIHNLGLPDRSLLAPPRILDFAAAQNVDPAQPFTLRWTPAFTPPDFPEFEVYDAESGERVFDAGFLEAPLDSATIPANILQPGRVYSVDVTVTRVDTEDFDNVPVRYASTSVTTTVPLRTVSGGGGSLSITLISVDPDGSIRCTVECQPGIQMELQRSTGLGSNWQTAETTIPESSPATLVLPAASLGDVSFLRAVQ